MNIAMLDDEQPMLNLVRLIVQAQGWRFSPYASARSFLEAAPTQGFDLIVLDWMVPDASGIDVARLVRYKLMIRCPMMMVSCRHSDHSVAYALQQGVDDYMVKPLRPAEFLARVHLLLKRPLSAQTPQDHVWGAFAFDRIQRTIEVDGIRRDLTAMEFDLAFYLFMNHDARIGRNQILICVFRKTGQEETRTVDIHAGRIRKKLELDGSRGFKLVSEYGFGYRLLTTRLAPQPEGAG